MRRPRLRLPLSLLLGLLAVLGVIGHPATAHAATTAETRVGASAQFSVAHTGLAAVDVIDTQRGNSAAYEETAVGDLLAADATAVATDEGGSLLGRLAESCATNSFSAGTLVVMADGSTRAISHVKTGDQVEATDPATGKTVAATVSHVFLNDDRNLADLDVRQGNGSSAVLHATQGHRFWDETLSEWVPATQLRAGDALRSDDGSSVVVEAVRSWQGSEWMHDLTVDSVHTFYVVAGSATTLVHNCASQLGDLTEQEAQRIQSVVDQAGRPLHVVGSAARGARRVGSDIDYTSGWADYFNEYVDQLPGMTDHGILQGGPDPYLGPSITFEPTNPTWP